MASDTLESMTGNLDQSEKVALTPELVNELAEERGNAPWVEVDGKGQLTVHEEAVMFLRRAGIPDAVHAWESGDEKRLPHLSPGLIESVLNTLDRPTY